MSSPGERRDPRGHGKQGWMEACHLLRCTLSTNLTHYPILPLVIIISRTPSAVYCRPLVCGSRRLDSCIRLRALINTHQTGPSNSKALRRYRSERALRCEGPALSVKIGVEGCVNTHWCVGCINSFKAYGVVEGTCGMYVVGLVRSLCWYSHHTFTTTVV